MRPVLSVHPFFFAIVSAVNTAIPNKTQTSGSLQWLTKAAKYGNTKLAPSAHFGTAYLYLTSAKLVLKIQRGFAISSNAVLKYFPDLPVDVFLH